MHCRAGPEAFTPPLWPAEAFSHLHFEGSLFSPAASLPHICIWSLSSDLLELKALSPVKRIPGPRSPEGEGRGLWAPKSLPSHRARARTLSRASSRWGGTGLKASVGRIKRGPSPGPLLHASTPHLSLPIPEPHRRPGRSRASGSSAGEKASQDGLGNLVLTLISCVALGRSAFTSEPQFPHL